VPSLQRERLVAVVFAAAPAEGYWRVTRAVDGPFGSLPGFCRDLATAIVIAAVELAMGGRKKYRCRPATRLSLQGCPHGLQMEQ
jgi:hypothetical protein